MRSCQRRNYLIPAAMILALLIVLTACGGGSPREPSVPKVEVKPLNVSVSTALEQKVSQKVGPDGGTLEASGPDGTRFVLEIPKDAIPTDTVVTMTPLTSVEGLPFSKGLIGGVQFGPDGLRLQQPALLTVEPVNPVPVAEQVGFAYNGSGQDFHLAPLALRTDIIQVHVFGFSGAGVGHGSAAEAAAVTPASPLARLQQKIAQAIQRDREQGGETLSDETTQIVQEAMAEYQAFLDPLLKKAETDCALARQVLPEQFALEGQRKLFGSASNGTIWGSSIGKALDNCAKEALEELRRLCEEGADQAALQNAMAKFTSYERTIRLLGGDVASSPALGEILCKPKGWSGTISLTRKSSSNDGGWHGSKSTQATITFDGGGTGSWTGTEQGTATWTSGTYGCAKQQTTEFAGKGPAVLYVDGPGAPSGDSNTGPPTAVEGELLTVDIMIESDGSYRLNFGQDLAGTSHMVKTGPSQHCEVGEDSEETYTSFGISAEGKGSPNPNQLSGSYTIPIEDGSGKKVGETTVTWNLTRR